jgi:probable HAF family extracellular repeat protein
MGWIRDRRRPIVAPALLLALTLLASSPVDAAAAERPAARRYEIVDLGTLPGGTYSEAYAINDVGWVVGWSATGDPEGDGHAVVWRNGQIIDLGTLSGSGSSSASDVNNRGEIVGSSRTATGELHPTLWRDGEIIDLGTLGGRVAEATGINDQGDVVGWSSTTPADEEFHAFLWRDGQMTDLGTYRDDTFSAAQAINDRGVVVGDSGGPVVWRRGVPTGLRLLPGAYTGSTYDNNDRGDVVGIMAYPSGASLNRAVIWRRGVPTDLGLERGSSFALGVNNRGQVVGWREPEPNVGGEPFLWERGRATILPTLTGEGGSAVAINHRGEIVGNAPHPDDPFGLGHAVLWR